MFVLMTTILYTFVKAENYHAATSYTNAKEFYISTSSSIYDYHTEMINGSIYYATSAKLAVSSTNTRYRTIGFDIELTGNGHSVFFSVQRTGGSMTEVNSCKDTKYEYNLYVIDDETLFNLARAANPTEAEYVLSAATINVKMDAILATMDGDTINGGMKEDGYGNFTYWGKIYRLVLSDDLKALKKIFTGHDFESYYNIEEDLDNHQLSIRYNLQGLNSTSSTTATVGNGFSISNDYLAVDKTVYIQNQRVLQQMTLVDPDAIQLEKEGYHLNGDSQWISNDSRTFSSSNVYMPKTIEPLVASQDKGITLYANWIPNTYTVRYDANSGEGSVAESTFTFDTEQYLRKNKFTKTGYKPKEGEEWNSRKNGKGTSYSSDTLVSNLSSEENGTITLYANWEPRIFKISLDNQSTTERGTIAYYERYKDANYENETCKRKISSITKPEWIGRTFQGYWTGINGAGSCFVDENGKILSKPDTFITDTTLYANWKLNTYTIKYHANGGTGTMKDTTAEYTKTYRLRTRTFTNKGYDFAGWATDDSNGAVVYEDQQDVKDLTPVDGGVINLYAVWEPIVYEISLDSQGGGGGTGFFYEKYSIGFYAEKDCKSTISSVTPPQWNGHEFLGYFESIGGKAKGERAIVNPDGTINANIGTTYFSENTTLYADWKEKSYTITFHKEGGTGGSDSVSVTYGYPVPSAGAPSLQGYTFKGYYTGKNGTDTKYYNEHMGSDIIYQLESNLDLYAYWVDEEPPTVTLSAVDGWSKDTITLTAESSDFGTGLQSLVIYLLDANNHATAKSSNTSLNGAKTAALSFNNPTEGVIRYKAVATDKSGKTAEVYRTVYYDKTAPALKAVESSLSGTTFFFRIHVSDIKSN